MYSSATAVSDPSLHSGQEVRRPVVLAQFARRSQNATARDETDPSLSLRARLEALLIELERVIQETLQPEEVRVWLRETEIEV